MTVIRTRLVSCPRFGPARLRWLLPKVRVHCLRGALLPEELQEEKPMHTRTSSLTRPAHLAVTLLALMLSLSGSAANAQQDYPNKPVRLVIPYPAGGTTDLLGRMTGQRLAAQWKQPVIADNRPGAGGSLGAAAVAKAPADGYQLVLGNSASHGAWELLYPGNPPYNALRDFTPVSLLATTKLVLVVRTGLPARTAAELVAMARATPSARHSSIRRRTPGRAAMPPCATSSA